MKTKNYIFSLCRGGLFALAYFSVAMLFGQQAPTINIQGILRDAKGRTVDDGAYTVTFKLYTVRTDGTALWQETADVEASGGIYSHNLGSVTPLNADNFSSTLYLGVRLNGFELTPRTELTYAPYTFSVSRALKVACSGAVGDIKYSILSPTEFATVNGDCWVPMNGAPLPADCALRQLTGMTTLPDAGGLFIRAQEFSGGQNNDPDRTSSSAVATVQNDAFKSHSHTASTDGNHGHIINEALALGSGGPAGSPGRPANVLAINNDQTQYPLGNRIGAAGDHTHTLSNEGGAETRVKNLNFWIYIIPSPRLRDGPACPGNWAPPPMVPAVKRITSPA